MQYRPLGATGDKLSAICMGTWEIGGLAWGPMGAPDAVKLVHAAFDAGITAFDTAEQYGNGRAEVILGAALKGRRDEVFIISKTGWMMGADGAQMLPQGQFQDFSAASITKACEQGLRRLQTHYIDAYLLHDPPMHIVAQDDPFEALQRLQQAGKIRWWGVSGAAPIAAEAIRRWGAQVVETPFNAFLTAAAADLFPIAVERGVGVLARSPFASGLLTLGAKGGEKVHATDWRRFVFKDRWGSAEAARERLIGLAKRRGENMTDSAIKFVLAHQAASTCIVGLASTAEVKANAPAGNPPYLKAAELAELAGRSTGAKPVRGRAPKSHSR